MAGVQEAAWVAPPDHGKYRSSVLLTRVLGRSLLRTSANFRKKRSTQSFGRVWRVEIAGMQQRNERSFPVSQTSNTYLWGLAGFWTFSVRSQKLAAASNVLAPSKMGHMEDAPFPHMGVSCPP